MHFTCKNSDPMNGNTIIVDGITDENGMKIDFDSLDEKEKTSYEKNLRVAEEAIYYTGETDFYSL